MEAEPSMPFLLEVAIKVTLVLVIPGLLTATAVVIGPDYRQRLALATAVAMTAGFLGGCSVFAGLGYPVGRWPLVKRWLLAHWPLACH